jgi:beta-lactamase regulating signal transducer with metallopeptidase domain/predicted Zn-dependent protease
MLSWVLYNTVIAAGLCGLVALLCRFNSVRPALCHLLWLLVLAALVAPPVPMEHLPGAALREELGAWIALPAAAERGVPAMPDALAPGALALPAEVDMASWPVAGEALPITDTPARSMPAAILDRTSLTSGLLALWALGSLLVLARHGVRILAFDRRVSTAEPAPATLERAVDEVADRLTIAPPPVRLLPGVGSPSVWCFGRPRLLWPTTTAAEGAGDPALIAHELAHIARKDHWVARLIALAEVLLWWHPLFWLVRRRVHDYSELSCDAWALWAYPADRRAYAEALIEAQERTVTAPLALQGLCATGRDVKDFRRRLTMIMSRHVSPRVSRVAATLAIVATVLVLPGFSDETKSKARSQADGAQADWAAGIARSVDVHVLSTKGEKLFKDEQFDQARAVFAKLLAIDPENGTAHARMGYMAIASGDYELALKHLGRQLAVGHSPEVAAYNKACAFSLAGEPKAAQKALAHAVQLGFRNAELLASDADLAAVRETEGFAKAKQALARVEAIESKLSGIGGWLMSDEDELALRSEMGDIVTGNGKAQHDLGLALLAAGHAKEAAVAFKRQAAGGFSVANAHYNLACAQAVSGDVEGAHQALVQAAELGMNHAAIHDDTDLASLHDQPWFGGLADRIASGEHMKMKLKSAITSGDVDTAAQIVKHLADAGGPNSDSQGWASLALGRTLLDQGRVDEAVGFLHLAADSGYELDAVSFQLSRANAALGYGERALRHLDDALTLGYADGEAVASLLQAHPLGNEETRYELLLRAQAAADEAAWLKDAKAKKKKAGYADGGDGQAY